MCIASDFTMYYSDSFVGVQFVNEVRPFKVFSVDYSDEVLDEAEDEGFDSSISTEYLYSEHHLLEKSLVFVGNLLNSEGEYTLKKIPMHMLMLENPQLGYIYDDVLEEWDWFTYSPNQSVKKGFTARRVQGREIDNVDIYKLFNIKVDEHRLDFDTVNTGSRILYKGIEVADVVDSVIELRPEFKCLKRHLSTLINDGLCLGE